MEMISRNRCFGALGFVIFINKLLLYVLKKGSAAEHFVISQNFVNLNKTNNR